MDEKTDISSFLFPYYWNFWYFTRKNSINSKEKQFIPIHPLRETRHF